MLRFFLAFALLIQLSAITAFGQGVAAGFDLSNYGVRIEPDKRVMAVLATIEAGRTTDANGNVIQAFSTPLSADGQEFRELLNSDLVKLDDKLRQDIATFLLRYKRANANKTDAQLVAPFISMAHSLSPAPDLADPLITSDLPGALLDVLDFAPLVREFYRRSSFSNNVDDYIKRYQESANKKLRPSSREMVSELLTYLQTRPQLYVIERATTETRRGGNRGGTLRIIENRERERRFFIVPEMLAPSGTINFVNIRDDYHVIVPPDFDVNYTDVRRAYLQFVIDPIILQKHREIETVRPGIAKFIEAQRKEGIAVSPDVFLTISRSLVAAIDAKQVEKELSDIAFNQARARIDQLDTDQDKRKLTAELERIRQIYADETILRLSEDYEKGAVLAFYFSEQLKGVEESGFDVSASVGEMMISLDPAKLESPLAKNAEIRQRALASRKNRGDTNEPMVIENPVTNRLITIQESITAKNFSKADADLKSLLSEFPNEPRIFFNIGRVASLTASGLTDPEKQSEKLLEAKVAFENVLRSAQSQRVEPAILSHTYIELGRIFEFHGELEYSVALYDAAINLGDVTGGGYKEALSSKARVVKELQ